MTLEDIKKFVPDLYDTSAGSGVEKILLLIKYVMDEIDRIDSQLEDLKDPNDAYGHHLELWASDYKLKRNGSTNPELRTRFLLARSANVNPVSVAGIYNALYGIVTDREELLIIERSDASLDSGALWDGSSVWDGSKSWAGSTYRPRAFDIDLDFVSGTFDPEVEAAIKKEIDRLRPAGILATVDFY